MIYTAFYYQSHFAAGLVYAGRNEDHEEEWIGDDEKWKNLENIENEYGQNN